MVRVTQTEDEIKIVIELNRLLSRRPDIVLLPKYLKFNNPPIFFERHLTNEIDEAESFCKIYKSEARIVLIKKTKGLWPDVFQKLTKEELSRKRIEISDLIIERNKEKDKQAIERYEQKKRAEIDREIRRDTEIRERVKTFESQECRQAMMLGVKKEAFVKPHDEKKIERQRVLSANIVNSRPKIKQPVEIRATGKINFNFSQFTSKTPKRESQDEQNCPQTSSLD
ncbi:uncharacterized protein LOC129906052 [Episyrphus balteatus]|uniref:uncharacterized protein LOC129906052 n=1 Tax=Episyrphus balteatus TaxID=286459 RepID=UPI0024850219|nr:uncharacterized protein LOC129906052 [Episyrphus balteatus]